MTLYLISVIENIRILIVVIGVTASMIASFLTVLFIQGEWLHYDRERTIRFLKRLWICILAAVIVLVLFPRKDVLIPMLMTTEVCNETL
jgi:hypothetical protein